MIAGIILAAGASRRMGGTPKALLDFHGETFIERLIRIVGRVCDPVIVAVGYHEAAIRARVTQPVTWAVNPDPERGQLSSLQTALGAVPAEADGFLFIPVDCPAVKASTVERIEREFRAGLTASGPACATLVIPRCGDRRGHPVCAAPSLRDEFLALAPTAEAREVVHRHIPHTKYIDVDDPGILSDIDDPEAYRRLMEVEG